jgi:uncharacterized protein (DUF927 family)
MTKIKVPALKNKKTGEVIKAPSVAWSHTEVEAKANLKKKKVKEGFVTEKDQFVNRKIAAKIAKKAGEIKKKVKKLHTTDLRNGLKVKKKVLK